MRGRGPLAAAALLAWASMGGAAPAVSPHAGDARGTIKALSEAEVRDYLAGSGMGFAKAAELNRYPGPRHVLELADRLALSPEQREHTERLFASMRAEAVRLGEGIVAQERELDARFAAGAISAAEVGRRTAALGSLLGRLRATHLRAHLAQRDILTAEQRRQYDALRGYGQAAPATRPPGHHGH
ncbi:MAG TPA: Spy/CpxP family protein refolding chaperone [Methylomirabilota bacterium]|nr:Spy/CpxP family protein refolding chaperone [Methylomirabilota bacterium]